MRRFGLLVVFVFAACSAGPSELAPTSSAEAQDLGSVAIVADLASPAASGETSTPDLASAVVVNEPPVDLGGTTGAPDLAVETVIGDDPTECTRLGARGECVGSVVKWCSLHLIFARDCAAVGDVCVMTSGASGAVCQSP